MNICVINGLEKKGITYNLKELFLEEFRNLSNEITEFYLPRDLNGFCIGCTNCFCKGEDTCKDREQVSKIKEGILKADLLVFAYPTYVFHTPGTVKSLLDHLGHMWIVHRPEKAIFSKRAVIITQCLGAGTRGAVKDVKDSLAWWGIPYIKCYKGAIRDISIIWNELTSKRREALTQDIKHFANKISRINFSKKPKVSFIIKMKFFICRMMQKGVMKQGIPSVDSEHWKANGWLDKERPWKK